MLRRKDDSGSALLTIEQLLPFYPCHHLQVVFFTQAAPAPSSMLAYLVLDVVSWPLLTGRGLME